jgi:hypothetical protein
VPKCASCVSVICKMTNTHSTDHTVTITKLITGDALLLVSILVC